MEVIKVCSIINRLQLDVNLLCSLLNSIPVEANHTFTMKFFAVIAALVIICTAPHAVLAGSSLSGALGGGSSRNK